MSDTLNYYDKNAEIFVSETQGVDFHENQDRFLCDLSSGNYILDFGCGSGRDTKYFIEKGFQVDATDGSPEICRLASEYTGMPVKCMLFNDLDDVGKYDGIWACASILHLTEEELRDVMRRMARALKKQGIIYTSFKYGDYEGERNGRFFKDFTEESFHVFMKDIQQLEIMDMWLTGDVRQGRGEEKWLNVLLRKTNI